MSRPATVVVAIVVAAVLAAPFAFGIYVEAQVKERVALADRELKARNGEDSGVRLIGYRRGLFDSQADLETRVALTLPDRATQTATFKERVAIEHGPLPGILRGEIGPAWAILRSELRADDLIDSLAGLTGDPSELTPLRTALAGYPPAEIELRLSFDGRGLWSVRAKPFRSADLPCCSRLGWGALDMHGTAEPDLSNNLGTMTLDRLDLTARGDGVQMTLDRLGADFDLHRQPGGLVLGRMGWSVADAQVRAQSGEARLRDLSLSSESAASGPALDTRLNVGLKSAQIQGTDGIAHRLGAQFGLELRGLDLAAAAHLREALAGFQRDPADPALATQRLAAVLDLAQRSLQRDPSLRLTPLTIDLDGQRIDAWLELSLAGAGGVSLTQGPAKLLRYLTGKARLSVPENLAVEALATAQALAQRNPANGRTEPADPKGIAAKAKDTAEQSVSALLKQGLIRREGGNLVAELNLSPGGQLRVGGQLVPLALLGVQ